jgi:hypothetical protein
MASGACTYFVLYYAPIKETYRLSLKYYTSLKNFAGDKHSSLLSFIVSGKEK